MAQCPRCGTFEARGIALGELTGEPISPSQPRSRRPPSPTSSQGTPSRVGLGAARTLGRVAVDVLVVQHAEKVRASGDPSLTARGWQQALLVARWLASELPVFAVWSSPLRRARETAEVIADELGQPIQIDRRLTERMNWDENVLTFDAFLFEWRQATDDRTYEPLLGDSSMVAGARFTEAICEIAAAAPEGSTIVVVSHGGVTTDAFRTMMSDDALSEKDPDLISNGVPSCAVTRLAVEGRALKLVGLPSTAHLSDTTGHHTA